MAKTAKIIKLDAEQITDGGAETVDIQRPYTVTIAVQGIAPILFHRWNCEAVAAKASAAKGSKAKKTDNVESYMYRDDDGVICIPGDYLRGAIVKAAKFLQDPRSPRKSAEDLYKAGIVVLTYLAPLGVKEPDYLDQRRVTVQRAGITRTRPTMNVGWKAVFDVMVNLPHYIPPHVLQQVVNDAGKLIGLGDYRPTYGRFTVTGWSIQE